MEEKIVVVMEVEHATHRVMKDYLVPFKDCWIWCELIKKAKWTPLDIKIASYLDVKVPS